MKRLCLTYVRCLFLDMPHEEAMPQFLESNCSFNLNRSHEHFSGEFSLVPNAVGLHDRRKTLVDCRKTACDTLYFLTYCESDIFFITNYNSGLTMSYMRAVCHSQGIITGPQNNAIYATSQITLRCQATPGDRVQWHEYVTNPNGIIISDNENLIPGHPNFARYTLDADLAAGTFDLTISDTIVQDGGVYECSDENTGTFKRAQLVIIGKTIGYRNLHVSSVHRLQNEI
jgi:hypothetical protein